MKRAVEISLGFITKAKQRKICVLLEAYRSAVNFFISSIWKNEDKLDAETLARLQNTRLSARYKGHALRQALSIVISTRKAAKKLKRFVSMPRFNGMAILSDGLVTIENGQGFFDLMVKLSTLQKYKRIWLPCRKTRVLNKWIARGGELIQGCALSESCLILWVDLPDLPVKETGEIIGCDIGKNKMLAFSDENKAGLELSSICDKVVRRENGSNGKKRAMCERKNYINRVLNGVNWDKIGTLVVEDLKNLKHDKQKNRGRAFRRQLSPWTYAQVLRRMRCKCEENRVFLTTVAPAFTSQICPVCGYRDRNNRQNEIFLCLRCGYSADADYVGARNILARYLGSVKSPTYKATG